MIYPATMDTPVMVNGQVVPMWKSAEILGGLKMFGLGRVKPPHARGGRHDQQATQMFVPGSPACLSIPSLPGCNPNVVGVPGVSPGNILTIGQPQSIPCSPVRHPHACPPNTWPVGCDSSGCSCLPDDCASRGMHGLGALDFAGDYTMPLIVGAVAWFLTKKPLLAAGAAAGTYFLTKK